LGKSVCARDFFPVHGTNTIFTIEAIISYQKEKVEKYDINKEEVQEA